MGDINKQTVINAPAQIIFNFVSDPRNAPSYITPIKSIMSGPEGPLMVGQVWRADAILLGKQSVINLCLQSLDPPQVVAFSIDGDPAGTLSLHLTPDTHGEPRTRVGINLDVPKVPSIFLGAVMGGLLEGDLARLKARLEA